MRIGSAAERVSFVALIVSRCQEGLRVTSHERRQANVCGSTVTAIEWMAERREPGACLDGADDSSISAGGPIANGLGPIPQATSQR